jgi:hypothetical protein
MSEEKETTTSSESTSSTEIAASTEDVTSPEPAVSATPNPFAEQIAVIQKLMPGMAKDLEKIKSYTAEVLHETEEKPINQIGQVIAALTPKKAIKLLVKTLKIEGNGGLPIYNGTRRRTLGGIYFFLAQRWVDPKYRAVIWPELFPGHATINWADRIPLIKEAVKEVGQANIPRLILIGRPGKVIEKGKVVLTTMQPKPQPKSVPKGLPVLPEEPTTPYILYIGSKQWRKVKDSLGNKEDELIVEGYPAFNPQLKAITVFAIKTSTKLIEESRRTKQRTEAAPVVAAAS